MAKVEITTGHKGGRIVVDGYDMSRALRGFTLDGKPSGSELTLDVIAHEFTVNGEAQVYVKLESQQALINLGWTPPGEVRTAACCAKGSDHRQAAQVPGGEAP